MFIPPRYQTDTKSVLDCYVLSEYLIFTFTHYTN
jgi:hypothetical protein